MRDPKRINDFCTILKSCWEMVPDWRFGQLIENVYNGKLLFYLEDDKALNILKDYSKTVCKKKINLFCDMDGVVFDTVKTIVNMYNSDFKYYKNFVAVNPDDVKTWNFEECKLASKDYINTYFNQERFFNTLELMRGSINTLFEINELFNLNFVSHGYSPNLIGKEIWVKRNFPRAKFIGVNLKEHNDKSCVDMSGGIFIDDSAENLKTSNAEIKICFGKEYPWNKEWDGIRVDNWYDLWEFLLDYMKGGKV